MGNFAKNTTITFVTSVLEFVVGISTSIVIARILGPERKGIYSLALLLPSLVVTFSNLGISPATVYYVGKGKHSLEKIFGNNLLLGSLISGFGVLAACVIIIFFRTLFLKGVPPLYLFIAMGIIPVSLLSSYFSSILLGLQKIKKYNLISIVRSFSFLALVVFVLVGVKGDIVGAILASIASSLLAGLSALKWIRKNIGEPCYGLDKAYVKDISLYGVKTYVGNILGFLNYRLDMFLVNAFLNPVAVGYYSIAVGIAEKLWLVSSSASTVLFPRVAAEKNEKRLKEFTPIVSRNVLLITIAGAVAAYFLSRWAVLLLYSEAYLESIRPLQALLPGIVALSTSRVLANDIAGRGRPMLNNYMGLVMVTVNLVLNILWIPQMGIVGAALASTVSYSASLFASLIIYSRISGTPISKIMFVQKSDSRLYKRAILSVVRRLIPSS